MITRGSKIQLVNPMGGFTNVGEVCEVTDVYEDGTILFKFGNYHLGYMSYDEYLKYFKEYVDKEKRIWTEWISTSRTFPTVDDKKIFYFTYRNNGIKTEVKLKLHGKIYKSVSCCHAEDNFDEETGLNIAIARLKLKVLANEVDDYIKSFK